MLQACPARRRLIELPGTERSVDPAQVDGCGMRPGKQTVASVGQPVCTADLRRCTTSLEKGDSVLRLVGRRARSGRSIRLDERNEPTVEPIERIRFVTLGIGALALVDAIGTRHI